MITNAYVQARMSSTRLPGKVLADIMGKPMILHQIERLSLSKEINNIIVVTSTDVSDDELSEILYQEGIPVFRGSLDDVLQRYLDALNLFPCDLAVRITADCPLIDPQVVDQTILSHRASRSDYTSNTLIRRFPRGLDCEVFPPATLRRVSEIELSLEEHEHVTMGIYMRPGEFKLNGYTQDFDESRRRWTVDFQKDLDFVRLIYENLLPTSNKFTSADVREFLGLNPGAENFETSGR